MPRLAELLEVPRRTGFPAAYLLARLPNRRAARIAGCPPGPGEETRRELNRELDWFHRQLEPGLRQELAPVLLFFELPDLLAALRCTEAGDRSGVRDCLAASRLSRALRVPLGGDLPFPTQLRELGRRLAPFDPSLARLDKIRRERGREGLETTMAEGFLAAGLREHPAGPVRDFLDRQGDRQQLLRLTKDKRWQRQKSSGRLSPRLRRLHSQLSEIRPAISADPAELDHWLLKAMTRDFRRRSRTGGLLDQLLDYLWTCYLTARACGIQRLTELLGKERLREELVLPA